MSGCIDLGNPVADHPLNQGLISWWLPLPNNSGGTRLFDLKGRNHGTLTSGASWGTAPHGRHSVVFDGVNDHVNCGTISGLSGAAAASFSASLYRGSTATTVACGGSGGPSSGGNRFSLLWFSDSNLYVAAEGGAAAYGSCALSGTGWRHVVVSYDGAGSGNAGRLQVYVDGAAKSPSFTGTIPATLGTTNPWMLGMDSNNRYGGGSIGDVRLRLNVQSAASAWAEYHQWREGYPDLLRRAPRRYTFVPASGGGSSADLTGATSLAATLTRSVSRALSASETPSAALAKSTSRTLDAASGTPSGSLSKSTTRPLTASETPSGSTLAKSTTKPLTGSETPSAALAKSTGRTLDAASEAPSGSTLAKSTSRTIAADETPSAALAKSTARALSAASLSPSGSILTGFGRAFEASLSLSAAFTRSVAKALNGGVAPDAALLKSTARALEAASLAPSGGTASRSHGKLIAGALSLAGALTRSLSRALSAALSLAATLATEGGVAEAPGIRIRDSIRLDPPRDRVAFGAVADAVKLDRIRDRMRW